MDPKDVFSYDRKFCVVHPRDGEDVKGKIRLVSYQGEDDPDENFIIIGRNGIPFTDIETIEEITDPTEPDILIDELWWNFNDQDKVNRIFERLYEFLEEEHSEEEKQIIKEFLKVYVVTDN